MTDEPPVGGIEDPGRSQQYDRVMRSLARAAPGPICRLLGIQAAGTIESLSESFPARTRVPDQVLRIGPNGLLHLEFARRGERSLTPRMLIYRGLIMERFPADHLQQGVIVLGEGRVKDYDEREQHGFALDLEVLYLREQDPEAFLADPELAPLAVLTRGSEGDRATSLGRALVLISRASGTRRTELLEAAGVMATIHLGRHTIDQAVRETGMSMESIARFYEGTELGQTLIDQGRVEGRVEGRQEARAGMLASLLQERFGDRPEIELLARRLAQRLAADALRAIQSASTLDELLTTAR